VGGGGRKGRVRKKGRKRKEAQKKKERDNDLLSICAVVILKMLN
jgi:hypothetical protein